MGKIVLETKLFRIHKSDRTLELYRAVEKVKKETNEKYISWEFFGYHGRLETLAKYLLQAEILRDGEVVELDGLSKEIKEAQIRILKALEEAINA